MRGNTNFHHLTYLKERHASLANISYAAEDPVQLFLSTFTCRMSSALQLRQSVTLFRGYNATIFLDRNVKTPLMPSTQPALYEKKPLVNPKKEAEWEDWPVLSLHSSVEELVQ